MFETSFSLQGIPLQNQILSFYMNNLFLNAKATMPATLLTSIFSIMRARWDSTVRGLIPRK
jgi:hypothetical protein